MTSLSLKDLTKMPVRLASGHRLCAGCGESIIAKQILMGTESPVIVSGSTGCFEVSTTIFPYTSWNTPYIHPAFGNGAATCAGVETAYVALRKKGKISEDIKFVTPSILQHRLILTAEAEMEGHTPLKVTQRLIDTVEVPK